MKDSIIEVKDFRKTYGDFIAVDKVSFDVKQGEIFGLLGPNGANRRDFEKGLIAAAVDTPITLSLNVSHIDTATGKSGTEFTIPQGDAHIFLREEIE